MLACLCVRFVCTYVYATIRVCVCIHLHAVIVTITTIYKLQVVHKILPIQTFISLVSRKCVKQHSFCCALGHQTSLRRSLCVIRNKLPVSSWISRAAT